MNRASRLAALAAASSLIAATTLLSGCSTTPISPTAGATAASAPAAGSSLSPTEFAAAVKLPNTVLIDVRTPAEFASGHLATAVNLDVESADFATGLAALAPTKTYAVYCRSGNRSKVAMTAMRQAGFTQVYDLSGGITAWSSAGGQVIS